MDAHTLSETLLKSIYVGVGGTLVMDAWAMARHRWLNGRPVDYTMLGRWTGHMTAGRFAHAAIARAQALPGETALGWIAHYITGVILALALTALAGPSWLDGSRPGLTIGYGVVTIALPFLIMQPAMGAGFAASKTPAPWVARGLNLQSHGSFGIGLWLSASLLAL